MSENFRNMCLELADEPEKLAKFIKLYYDEEDENKKICVFCSDDCSSSECVIYQKNFCDAECALRYAFKNLDWKYIEPLLKDFNELRELYYYEIRENHMQKLISNKKISNRSVLINYVFSWKDINKYLEYIDFEDIDNVFESYFAKHIDKIVNYYKLENIKKSDIMVKKIIKSENSMYCNLILDIINENHYPLIFQYNEYLTKYLIEKFGKDKMHNYEPWKFITSLSIFKLLYENPTDEMMIHYNSKFSVWIFPDYIYKDPNLLFSSLNIINMTDELKKYYKINWKYHKILSFIKTNASNIKTEITKETLETFFTNMDGKNMQSAFDDFSYLMGYLIKNTKAENVDFNKFNYSDFVNWTWNYESYLKVCGTKKLNDVTLSYILANCGLYPTTHGKTCLLIAKHQKNNFSLEKAVELTKEYLKNNFSKLYDQSIKTLEEYNLLP